MIIKIKNKNKNKVIITKCVKEFLYVYHQYFKIIYKICISKKRSILFQEWLPYKTFFGLNLFSMWNQSANKYLLV